MSRSPLLVLALLSACTFVLKPDEVVIEADQLVVTVDDTGAPDAGGAEDEEDDTGAEPGEDGGAGDGSDGSDGSDSGEDEEEEEEEWTEAPVPVAVSSTFSLEFTATSSYSARSTCSGAIAEIVTPGEPFILDLSCESDAVMSFSGFDIVEEPATVTPQLVANPTETGWTARFVGSYNGLNTGLPVPPCTGLDFALTLDGSALSALFTQTIEHAGAFVVFGSPVEETFEGPCTVSIEGA